MPLTKIKSLGITDGTILGTDVNSTFDLTGKTVTLPAGVGGKVLQVVQATKLGTQSISGSSGGNSPETFTDITDLSVSITPSSTSNKILILASLMGSSSNDGFVTLFRNSTNLSSPTSPSGRTPSFTGDYYNNPSSGLSRNYPIIYLDSPSTTSSTTYKLGACVWETSPIFYVNRAENDTDSGYQTRAVSTLVVMEISG